MSLSSPLTVRFIYIVSDIVLWVRQTVNLVHLLSHNNRLHKQMVWAPYGCFLIGNFSCKFDRRITQPSDEAFFGIF